MQKINCSIVNIVKTALHKLIALVSNLDSIHHDKIAGEYCASILAIIAESKKVLPQNVCRALDQVMLANELKYFSLGLLNSIYLIVVFFYFTS